MSDIITKRSGMRKATQEEIIKLKSSSIILPPHMEAERKRKEDFTRYRKLKTLERKLTDNYLKGSPVKCCRCGMTAGTRAKTSSGRVMGVTLKKVDGKYYCQLCRGN